MTTQNNPAHRDVLLAACKQLTGPETKAMTTILTYLLELLDRVEAMQGELKTMMAN